MLRASSFCQRRSEKSHQVRLEINDSRKGDLDEDDPNWLTPMCWFDLALLRQACLIQRQWIWIAYRQKRIAVQVMLRPCTNKTVLQESSSSVPIVHLSALAAANLGFFLESCSSHVMEHFATMAPCRDKTHDAKHVCLRLYARPPSKSSERVEPAARSDETRDQNLTTPPFDESWPLPCINTILQSKTIIIVEGHDNETFWYQILRVNGEATNNQIYQSTTTTKYSLEAPPMAPCPRLPSFTRILPPHPNLPALSKNIQCLNVSRPAECILHLIGTDATHHLHVLVEATAKQTGRRLVTLTRGWAAHSYRENGRKLVSNGGLMDKLNGLEAALVQAKQCIPALLHVYFSNSEFSSHDDVQYQDEQSRIWNMIMEHLRECDYSFCNEMLVPPLVVIISSAAPFQRGLFLENFVFETVQTSMPDNNYNQYLWKKVPNVRMEEILSTLKGRPAREIEMLRDQFLQILNESTLVNEKPPLSIIQELTKEMDKKRRSGLARIPQVQWSDVGGLHSVRREILDTIELPLQHPHLFKGRRSGILLYGPPGSGKTLVAKAVATECNIPFLSVKGPELLGSYVGESEENVRTVFAQARQLAQTNQIPGCVLFFDELDSLAPRRGDQASGGGSVMDRVVATLFAELDKNVPDAAVYCLGATNRPDLLDPALLRPGRLDRLVYLGLSSREDQVKILAAQMRKLKLERNALEMARLVVNGIPANLSGADLSMIVSKALMRATENLCDEADKEAADMRNVGDESVSVDQILAFWDEDRLTPVIRLDDLHWASQHVVPSVSDEELKGYERLRDQFQISSPESSSHDRKFLSLIE
jgi:SpoVK/Ycf46/Vps4 family AAA+-type ATPase